MNIKLLLLLATSVIISSCTLVVPNRDANIDTTTKTPPTNNEVTIPTPEPTPSPTPTSTPTPTPEPTPSLTPTSTPPPTPEPTTPPPTPTPIIAPVPIPRTTPYLEDGTCPSGYVSYGVPLQCVTPEYMDYCRTNSCPTCLSANTHIDTPSGLIPVKDLQVGMAVWTTDKTGHRVSGVIIKTSKMQVPQTHQMVQVILDDGRELYVSPGHPTSDGRIVGNLTANDLYDGARVVTVDRVVYGDTTTFDILPSGETGFYWANDILFDSTLH